MNIGSPAVSRQSAASCSTEVVLARDEVELAEMLTVTAYDRWREAVDGGSEVSVASARHDKWKKATAREKQARAAYVAALESYFYATERVAGRDPERSHDD